MKNVLEVIKTWRDGSVEQLHDKAYDRFKLDNAITQEFSLFKSPVSTTRQGAQLTKVDTNTVATQIPVNEAWVMHGLFVRYTSIAVKSSANSQLVMDFLRNTYMAIKINGLDVIFECTLDEFFGPSQILLQPAATQNDKISYGMYTGAMKFEVPIPLQPQTNWELAIIPASAAGINNDFVKFSFDREKLRLS